MIYEATIDNLVMLMRSVGELNKDQLIKFFAHAHDSHNVEFYITQLCKDHMFDYDEIRNRVRFHKAPKLNDFETSKRIQAFWVITSFGCDNVRVVYTLGYPSQFLFVANNDVTYDLTVCLTPGEARLAAKLRKDGQVAGVPDDTNHVAIVNSKEEGEALAAYGFDSYCILDSNKAPHYSVWH